jgi:hypothetical protein
MFLSLYSNLGPVFRDIGKRMAGLSAAQTKISSQVGKIVKGSQGYFNFKYLFQKKKRVV